METARQNLTQQQGQGEKEVSKGPREQRRVKHAGQVAEQTAAGTVTALNPQEPGST